MPSPLRALPIAAVLLAALPGCDASRPHPSPLSGTDRSTAPTSGPARVIVTASATDPPIPEGATLTVAEVVAIARGQAPAHAVLIANRHAAAAQVTQARAWSNPEVEIELGRATTLDDERKGVGRVSIRQRFEWPGKRYSRITAAEAGIQVAASEARTQLLELAGEVSATAMDVALDQQAGEQARAAQALAKEVVAAIERRVNAGEASRSEWLRARVDVLQADQEVASLDSDLAAARAALSSLCGGKLPTAYTIRAVVDEDAPPSLEQALAAATEHHPEAKRLQTMLRQRQMEVERERAAAYPDLSVGVFAGKETDSSNLGVTLGLDLPLWNRNQGGVATANADLERITAELAVQSANLHREVEAAWRAYEKARLLAGSYTGALRPASQEALRLALGSYQVGESSVLDLLDARRTAQAIETATLDAQRQVHAAHIRLDLAMGTLSGTTP